MKRATLLLAALALSPVSGYAQSANAVAGLQQDVTALRDEVRKLRAEVEEVREAQTKMEAAMRARPAAAAPDSGTVNARIAAVESASAAARRADKAEMLAEMNARISAIESGVNKALAEQTKRVNAALRSDNAAKPTETVTKPKHTDPVAPKTPGELPSDMPKTGVKYTVVSGDSVTKIAKKLDSKPGWILAANGLRSNADLKAHSVIFVPQADAGDGADSK